MDVLDGEHLRLWIRAQVEPLVPSESPKWDGNHVRNCVPDRFEAYVKIFHPIYEDLTEPDREQAWDEWSRSDPSHRLPPLLEPATLTRMQGVTSRSVERVRWRRLAGQYNLVFHAEINDKSFSNRMTKRSWPKYLIGPGEGTLSGGCAERLAELLASRTGDQSCYFTYFPTAVADSDHQFALRARLADIDAVLGAEDVYSTPEYWWPEDFSWCVCSDWDLTFTLVGCSRTLADDILADDLLETIEARADHRVDDRADNINLPRA
jgi:hypothetical protein